jgi:RimJ/RimL family protein N-acetyltransferase
MIPVRLSTARLVLDQPTLHDVDIIASYCQDPVFEQYLTTPWPYTREDAVGFVTVFAVGGWESGGEYTWAIRHDGKFVGVIGYRTGRGDIGFWMGAPHRGNGYMTEAVGAVADWLFSRGVASIEWFCVAGNHGSASVARKNGFSYAGERPSPHAHRGHAEVPAWFGTLAATDSRSPKPGWPVIPN